MNAVVKRFGVIKSYLEFGEKCGIAKQVEGKVVEITPHPKHKGMWQFKYGRDTWICSDYAFKEVVSNV